MTLLRIPRTIFDEAIAHVTACLPSEGVGMLGGPIGGDVCRHIPLPNLLGGRGFLVDPFAQYQAMRAFAADQLVPLAVYHSHPGGGTDLSYDDRMIARSLPYLQIVLAVDRPRRPDDAAAYRISGAMIERVKMEIIDP